MPGELASRDRVVGLKQTRRAVMQGAARAVYLASDADPRLTEPLRELCRAQDVPCDGSMTLQQLGRACGIAVPAAAVAVLNGLASFPAGIEFLCSVENTGTSSQQIL